MPWPAARVTCLRSIDRDEPRGARYANRAKPDLIIGDWGEPELLHSRHVVSCVSPRVPGSGTRLAKWCAARNPSPATDRRAVETGRGVLSAAHSGDVMSTDQDSGPWWRWPPSSSSLPPWPRLKTSASVYRSHPQWPPWGAMRSWRSGEQSATASRNTSRSKAISPGSTRRRVASGTGPSNSTAHYERQRPRRQAPGPGRDFRGWISGRHPVPESAGHPHRHRPAAGICRRLHDGRDVGHPL